MRIIHWLIRPLALISLSACADGASTTSTYLSFSTRSVSELQVFSEHGDITRIRIASKQLEIDGTIYWELVDAPARRDGKNLIIDEKRNCNGSSSGIIARASSNSVTITGPDCMIANGLKYRGTHEHYTNYARALNDAAGRRSTSMMSESPARLALDLQTSAKEAGRTTSLDIVKIRTAELLIHANALVVTIRRLQSMRSAQDPYAKDIAAIGRAEAIRAELLFDRDQLITLGALTRAAIAKAYLRIDLMDSLTDSNECFKSVVSWLPEAKNRERCARLGQVLATYNIAKRSFKVEARELLSYMDECGKEVDFMVASIQ